MKVRAATVSDGDMLSVLATYDWITTYGGNGVSRVMASYAASEFSPARYRSRLMEKGRTIWVVEHRQRLVGFCEVFLRSPHKATSAVTSIDKFYLHSTFDTEEARITLFRHVTTELGKYQISAIWLTVWHQHKETLEFYANLGFQQVGEFFLEIDGEHHTHYILDNVSPMPA